jgi:hypothetical protein
LSREILPASAPRNRCVQWGIGNAVHTAGVVGSAGGGDSKRISRQEMAEIKRGRIRVCVDGGNPPGKSRFRAIHCRAGVITRGFGWHGLIGAVETRSGFR